MDWNPAILVMVKAPRAGQVKTRLSPPLSPDQAAMLAACFARDVVTAALSITSTVFLAYAPADGLDTLKEILPSGVRWAAQQGKDLGERMRAAQEHACAEGFSPLVTIGTDSPTLPCTILEQTVKILAENQADVVLGPAEDGGYYLVGLRHPISGLFDNVMWSTSFALSDTLRNAEAMNMRVAQLPLWYDIDTLDDLTRLCVELRSDSAAREHAPHTYHWLQNGLQMGDASAASDRS